MTQIACPGCGVSISPGQGICGFCARQREVDSKPGRGRLVALLVVATLVLGVGWFGLLRSGLLRTFQHALPVPPVVPSAEPVVPIPHIEVTETTLSLDGTKLLDLPSLSEQASVGVGASNEVAGNFFEITALRDALRPLRARPHQGLKVSITFAEWTPYRMVLAVLFTVGQGGFGQYRLEVAATSGTPSVALETYAPATRSPDKPKDDQPQDVRSLIATVGRSHVDLEARGNERREHVGFGCVAGGLGYSVHLGAPDDYATLAACLKNLKGVSPASSGASGTVTARYETPALTLLQVASLMQRGEPSCPQGPPPAPLFDGPLFSISGAQSPKPEAPDSLKADIANLLGGFRKCYQAFLAASPTESSYDAVARIAVRPDGRFRASVDPGLPSQLEQCIVSSIERAKIRYPSSTNGMALTVPLTFVNQGGGD